MAIYAVAKLGGICNMIHALTPLKGVQENMRFTKSRILLTYMPECESAAEKTVAVDVSDYMGLLYKTGYRLTSKQPNCSCRFSDFEKSCEKKAQIPEPASLAEKPVAYFSSSGTTGEPKTVVHCHRAINNSAENMIEYFDWHDFSDEIVLSELPTFHGFGFVGNLHVVLRGGGLVVQLARWDRLFAAKIIDRLSITMMAGVPKVFSDLLTVEHFSGKSLSQCFIAGDSVPTKIKKEFISRVGKKNLYEAYGMTEIVAACCACNEKKNRIEASGYPINNCRVSILRNGEIFPSGEGELLVLTNTMMLGYLNETNPEKPSYYFFNDGLSWMRTGDVGKIDEEGFVYCEGRIKDVIIFHGYLVFPKQLERLALEIDVIHNVCVVGKKDSDNSVYKIIAYIESEQNSDLVCKMVEQKWKEVLPAYAVPSIIHVLREFPHNDMGKIDKVKLESML